MRIFNKLLMMTMLALLLAVPLHGADMAHTTHTSTLEFSTSYPGDNFTNAYVMKEYSVADSLDWGAGAAGADTLTMVLVPSMDIRGLKRVQFWAYLDGFADSWAEVDADDSIFSVVAGDTLQILLQVSPDGNAWEWITSDTSRTDAVMAATDTANVRAGAGPKAFVITLDRNDPYNRVAAGGIPYSYARLVAHLDVAWNEAVATTVNFWWKSGMTGWK